MIFSLEAKESVSNIWDAILKHPFLIEMALGTLPLPKFRYYLSQDSVYLKDLLSALLIASSKAESHELRDFLVDVVKATIEGEVAMQRELRNVLKDIPPSPGYSSTTLAYTSYMLRVAVFGTPRELMASLAPCFWSYAEIGLLLKDTKGAGHEVYRIWISGYASEEYQSLVKRYLEVLDAEAAQAEEGELERMMEHFKVGTWYEKKFWDMSYIREPILYRV